VIKSLEVYSGSKFINKYIVGQDNVVQIELLPVGKNIVYNVRFENITVLKLSGFSFIAKF